MKRLTIIALLTIWIHTISKGEIDEKSSEFTSPLLAAENAYSSKDIRSIQAICANRVSQNYLIDILSSAPESQWKEEVMIELLKSPWHLDRTAGRPTPPGTPPVRLYQLAVDYLAPYIPEEGLKHNDENTYRKLSNFEERKQLAERFRDARIKKVGDEKIENNSNNGRLSTNDASIPPGTDFTLFTDDDKRTESAASNPDKDNESNILVRLLSVVIGFTLLMFLIWKYRTKHPKKNTA
jgi:hypothetical protein